MTLRFNLSNKPLEPLALSDIQDRASYSRETNTPFTFNNKREARTFTTMVLPEFPPSDVSKEWVLQSSQHVNYPNVHSWLKAIQLLESISGTRMGASIESRTERVAIIHIYSPRGGGTH